MINTVIWEDPPDHTGAGHDGVTGKWEVVLDQLVDNPGTWGVIATFGDPSRAYNLNRNLRRGILRGSKRPGFTFRSRRAGDEWRVYGRYDPI